MDYNAPVNRFGQSYLHVACTFNNPYNVLFYIQNGSDPNLPDLNGNTPLHIACMYGHLNIVKILVDCGSYVFVINKRGEIPANMTSNDSIYKFLMDL